MSKQLRADETDYLRKALQRDDLRSVVESYAQGALGQGVRHRRSRSYDHCYNFFSDTADLDADMEKSCAVLGFYLASWGMYRGSSYLLKYTNSSDLQSLVHLIQLQRRQLQAIDVDDYSDANMTAVCESFGDIAAALNLGNHRSITLVTKVMAGVFGCVPAFDRNFRRGFSKVLDGHAKLPAERFNVRSLQLLRAFYLANRSDIDELQRESRTVAFVDGAATHRHLTRAKIIDMYCFELGK